MLKVTHVTVRAAYFSYNVFRIFAYLTENLQQEVDVVNLYYKNTLDFLINIQK